MAYCNHFRTRQVAAVHALLGIVFELGGTIVDGYAHLDGEVIDAMLEELRVRIEASARRLARYPNLPAEPLAAAAETSALDLPF